MKLHFFQVQILPEPDPVSTWLVFHPLQQRKSNSKASRQRMANSFDQQKSVVLEALERADRSPKGSVDEAIVRLIRTLNDLRDVVSTSSCSGRVSLFRDGTEDETRVPEESLELGAPEKGTGKWIAVNHDRSWEPQEMEEMLKENHDAKSVVFKAEPFVLHAMCRDVASAQDLLSVARECGFRESGLSVGSKKIMLAVRTNANVLEVPLVHDGVRLFGEDGLVGLCKIAKLKFQANKERWQKFEKCIEAIASNKQPSEPIQGKTESLSKLEDDTTYDMSVKWHLLAFDNGDDATETLKRWGHTATAINHTDILVIGGHGLGGRVPAAHGRLDDVLLLRNLPSGHWDLLRKPCLPDSGGNFGPSGRTKHTATLVESNLLVVFGGRHSPGKPQGDLYILDTETYQWLDIQILNDGPTLKPRWGHTAVSTSNGLFIFGGRDSYNLFNDVWSIKISKRVGNSVQVQFLQENTGVSTSVEDPEPCPRYLHSANPLPDGNFVVYGGYTDLLIHDKGLEETITGDVHIFDTKKMTWKCLIPNGSDWTARFSHQSVLLGNNKLLVIGGVTRNYFENSSLLFDLTSRVWYQIPSNDSYAAADPPVTMLQKSALVLMGANKVVSIGGGVLCFSFGSYFGPCLEADASSIIDNPFTPNAILTSPAQSKEVKVALEKAGIYDKKRRIGPFGGGSSPKSKCMAIPIVQGSADKAIQILHYQGGLDVKAACAHLPRAKGHHQKNGNGREASLDSSRAPTTPLPIAHAVKPPTRKDTGMTDNSGVLGPCILATPNMCKAMKTALEEAGLYDKSRIIGSTSEGSLALPIIAGSELGVVRTATRCLAPFDDLQIVEVPLRMAKLDQQHSSGRRQKNLSKFGSPSSIRTQIVEWLRRVMPAAFVLDEAKLKKEIPNKIELLQDVAILPRESFRTAEIWDPIISLGEVDSTRCLWGFVARLVGADRVLRQAKIDTGFKRASLARLVFPRDSKPGDAFVKVKQYGVWYSFDMEKCMFSSGNITEKERVGSFPCSGETVVDMFAGIGYFTLPYLIKAGAAFVHACEWNADALEALRGNLSLNKIDPSRFAVHPGDCKVTIDSKLRGIADRVNLGLIPSSEPFWEYGVAALRSNKQGWLHIHENVDERKREEWVKSMTASVEAMCQRVHGKGWTARCAHVERVKSYGPHVDHIVADVQCCPPGSGPSDHSIFPEGHSTSEQKRSTYLDRIVYPPMTKDGGPRCAKRMPYPRTKAEVENLLNSQEPVVLEGVLSPEEINRWSLESVLEQCKANKALASRNVSVHVSKPGTDGKISFVDKSFSFEVMAFQELVEKMLHESGPRCYLRAIGPNPRKDRAHFWKDYKDIADSCNFNFPSHIVDQEKSYFSSVFRMASKGLQLWTHYDVMHNILYQMHGKKRIVLFQPESVGSLDFHGSSSNIIDIDSLEKLDENCPFSLCRKAAIEVYLQPGEALFIPALWPHNARAEEPSVAVNIFWKHLSNSHYASKDLYGNRDPILAEKALELVAKAKDVLNSAQDDGTTLPQYYVDFYSEMAHSVLRH